MTRRLVITALVGVALFGIVYAFTIGQTGEPGQPDREGVSRVFPAPGAQEIRPPGDETMRDLEIGVEFEPGWTGTLQVEGVEIPPDQLRRVPELFQVWFRPGPGKAIEELRPGRHCATALAWRINETRDDARSIPWCFQVMA